jgi:hypothetical protein
MVDEDGAEGVDEDADGDHAGGEWSPPEEILARFPPSLSTVGGLLTLCLRVFDLHRRLLEDTLGVIFFLG